MNRKERVILVTGATGQQGGATARHLIDQGWTVRGLTRNSEGASAEALAKLGAQVVQGDLDDRTSIDAALDGVYGVYSFPNMAMGIDNEIRQGKLMADAAKAAGVKHFVQGSVGGVERNTGVPHFDSKWEIEEYVRSLGLPATFLRPVFFMDNLNWKREQILGGVYEGMGMSPEKPLQLIAVNDIGAFAALVFAQPERWIGQGLEIAGDELTEVQMADVMTRVTGRPVALVQPTAPPTSEDMAAMVQWFDEKGYEADIPALRTRLPTLMDFEGWLRQAGWENADR